MLVVRPLGNANVLAAEVSTTLSHVPNTHMVLERNVAAIGVLLSGLGSATSLLLFAIGRHKEAYALGISSALVGAVIGAVRILATDDESH